MRQDVTTDSAPAKPRAGNRGMGRPRGALNRKTAEMRAAVEEAQRRLGVLVPAGMLLDAHALLQTVYRDPDMPVMVRLEAARAALRVEKPTLATTALSGDLTVHTGIADRLGAARQRLASVSDHG